VESLKDVEEGTSKEHLQCREPIDEIWYLLVVPIARCAWAALFRPRYKDIPVMAAHGVLAYAVYWLINHHTKNTALSNFAAAVVVAAVAGIVSRFTGQQALGNTLTGLYSLVPGIYLTEGLFAFSDLVSGLDEDGPSLVMGLFLRAVMVGLGAWTGTLLCAPTILGTNNGLLSSQKTQSSHPRGSGMGAMLFI